MIVSCQWESVVSVVHEKHEDTTTTGGSSAYGFLSVMGTPAITAKDMPTR